MEASPKGSRISLEASALAALALAAPASTLASGQVNLGANLVEASFEVTNQGHMRHEIEIGLHTLNGSKFIGSIM